MSQSPAKPPTTRATVVVRTIGRTELLRNCLASLAQCDPPPDEVVVVNHSDGGAVEQVVREFTRLGARAVADAQPGRGRALNVGLRAASYELVLVTDDDCTVASDWVAVAKTLFASAPEQIFTGRVLPVGNARLVPSTISSDRPRDYTGKITLGVLYVGNMVCSRRAVLGFGGFDEGIVPSAEDNEFCFRWLKAGRTLRYEPALVVWHHDWRTPEQLGKLQRDYARGAGVFYGTHLRAGEMRMLGYLCIHLLVGIYVRIGSLLRRGPRDCTHEFGVLLELLLGFAEGLRRQAKRPLRARGFGQSLPPL